MTFPTVENGPWVFNINNISGKHDTSAELRIWAFFNLKEVLISFDEWSVVASANGSSFANIGAGGDVDLWDTISDIVAGSSWVVVENSVTGEQLCIDAYSATTYYGHFRYSATGSFQADGDATTPPTVTESIDLLPISTIWIDMTCQEACIHGMISADGKCTRIYVHQREITAWTSGGFLLLMEELADTPDVWTSTHKRCILRSSPTTLTTTTYTKTPALSTLVGKVWYCHLKDASPSEGNFDAYPTACCYLALDTTGGLSPFVLADRYGFSNGYCLSPIGIFRPDADHGGGLGRLQDMFWAPLRHDTFQTYDQPTDKAWIKIGGLILPWNGTAPAWL